MHDYSLIASNLKNIVGENNVLKERVDLALYACDGETLDSAMPDLVVLPGSTGELQAVVKAARQHNIPFTARGAGTGLSGGATTVCGGISLVLSRMTKIINIDPQNQTALVETGVTNSAVSQAAAKFNLCFAPDPSSQTASTIGGNIAENAGGPHTLKYGTTTDHVLGMKVVLPDGTLVTYGTGSICRLGFDWLSLLTGSEGTLGIVSQATLRLLPVAESVETALAYFPTLESAAQAVSDIVAAGIIPCAMEMIDQLTINAVEDSFKLGLNRQAQALLIIEIDGSKLKVEREKNKIASMLEACEMLSFTWAKGVHERAQMWKARKAAVAAYGRLASHGYVLDGVVPRSKLAQALNTIKTIAEEHSVLIANVVHAGDGNLHPCLLYNGSNEQEVARVLKASYAILKMCVDLGGTLSGEHGIGIEKAEAMPFLFTADDLSVMEWVKKAFDPDLCCNPGKILPNPAICGESGRRPLARHKLSLAC